MFYNNQKQGKVKWDDNFDISDYDSQLYLYEACNNLTYNENLVFQSSSIVCPMTYFQLYLLSIGEQFPYIYTYDNSTIQKQMFNQMMYNFAESSFAFYLNENNLIYVSSSEYDDSDSNEESEDSDDDEYTFDLKYIAIGTYTDNAYGSNLEKGRERQQEWYDWVDANFNQNDNCPQSLRNGVSTALRWALMRTNREFFQSAFQGIGIALPCAFMVLVISTKNIIVSIFAIIDIIGVMACELAIMQLMGWKFGVSESVSVVFVIGFSVDYVVHLANAYLECPSGIRKQRISHALLTMGTSVTSGAITTIVAGMCLIGANYVIVFNKMSIIIIATISLSFLWAMVFFIALLAQCGPSFQQGNIPFLILPIQKIKNAMKNCTVCKL